MGIKRYLEKIQWKMSWNRTRLMQESIGKKASLDREIIIITMAIIY